MMIIEILQNLLVAWAGAYLIEKGHYGYGLLLLLPASINESIRNLKK